MKFDDMLALIDEIIPVSEEAQAELEVAVSAESTVPAEVVVVDVPAVPEALPVTGIDVEPHRAFIAAMTRIWDNQTARVTVNFARRNSPEALRSIKYTRERLFDDALAQGNGVNVIAALVEALERINEDQLASAKAEARIKTIGLAQDGKMKCPQCHGVGELINLATPLVPGRHCITCDGHGTVERARFAKETLEVATKEELAELRAQAARFTFAS